MKFLANENFPAPSIRILRDAGYDVKSIQEVSPKISDEIVLETAKQEDRIILTFDKDYGKLIFQYNIQAPSSVIFFRVKGDDPLFAGSYLLALLKSEGVSFGDCFAVIETNGIRQRKYP